MVATLPKTNANFQVMLECSAMPLKVKRTVLTQEVIRILRNCRTDLPWAEKASFLTDLSARMKASGYSEKFREQIIDAGLKGFDKMTAVAEAGGRPINRPSSWQRQDRKRKKMAKKENWHRGGGFHVPLFVPCTPNGELAKRIKAVEESNCLGNRCVRFKIVETGGDSVKSLLQRSDQWSGGRCGRPKCFPCKGEKGGDCKRSCVTYKITCLECKLQGVVAEYCGETYRNMYSRGKEHLDDYRNKTDKSVLWAHCVDKHDSCTVQFSMELTGSFRKPLPRQVSEAVQINNIKGESFNRKQEFRLPAVARPVFTRELQGQ